jgi:hypothetical protein
MQKYVTMNWWEGNDGLEVPVHVVRYGHTPQKKSLQLKIIAINCN